MIIALVILGGIVCVLYYMLWEIKDRFDRHQSTFNESLYNLGQRISNVNSNLKLLDSMVTDSWGHFTELEKLHGKSFESIEKIHFRLDNVQLYDIGDKVDREWIVTSVDLVSYPKLQYNYSATNIKTGETKTWAE